MRNEALDFDEFYRGSYPKVFAAAFTVSGDRVAALDAVQEAFERAFMRWSRLGREPWAEGWVMTTAMNFCRRTATRTAKEHLVPSVMEGGQAPVVDSERVDLVTAIRRLPWRQRQATVLFYLGDLPLGAVAELMSLSEGTVKAHLAQARKALRRSLEVSDV